MNIWREERARSLWMNGQEKRIIKYHFNEGYALFMEVRTRVEQKLPELFEDTKEMEDFSSLLINKLIT